MCDKVDVCLQNYAILVDSYLFDIYFLLDHA